ncbi:MAG: hypothetical protein AB7L91_17170 [Dehalococcoidia bacterium]
MQVRAGEIVTVRAGDLLAPVLTAVAFVVALAYIVVGLSLVIRAWHLSAGWCAATLAFFIVRKLAWRR